MARKASTATKRKTTAKKTTARKPAAKKPAAKKTPVKKAPPKKADPIDDLEKEIDDQLGQEFDFDSGDNDGLSHYLEKTVRFEDDTGAQLEGKVTKVNEDKGEIEVETEDAFYDLDPERVEIVDDEEPEEEAPPPKKAAKKKPAKKAAAKVDPEPEEDPEEEPEEEEEGEDVPDIRWLAVKDIKKPKKRTRGVDKDSDKYKIMKADFKKNGQDKPIKVTDFDDPYLVSGLRRLSIAEDLGVEFIMAKLSTAETDSDRIFEDLRDNEMREQMHWVDIAQSFAILLADGAYSTRTLARTFGYSESTISRMVSALKLPKGVMDHARGEDYSKGVFLELASANEKAKPVVKEVAGAMKNSQSITMADVRALVKEHKKKSGTPPKKPGKKGNDPESGDGNTGDTPTTPPKPPRSYTYADLANDALGDNIRIRVHREHVTVKFEFDWTNKKFSKLDLVAELSEAIDAAFADDDTTVKSKNGLIKAMNEAKASIGE